MADVRIIGSFYVNEGTSNHYADAWSIEFDIAEGQPGHLQYELFHSKTNPEHFVVIQEWEHASSFHSYWDVQRVLTLAGEEFLVEPERGLFPEYEMYSPVAEHRFDDGRWLPLKGESPTTDPGQGVRLIALLTDGENAADPEITAGSDGESGAEGCLQYEMFVSTVEPDKVLILGHWVSIEAFEAHTHALKDAPVAVSELDADRVEVYFGVKTQKWDGAAWQNLTGATQRS